MVLWNLWKWKAIQWQDKDGNLKNSWDIIDGNENVLAADLLEEEALKLVKIHNRCVEEILQLSY